MARTGKKIRKYGDPRKGAPTPQPQPRVSHVTPAKEWRRVVHMELTLPSGNTCLVRRPGLPEMLSSGIFPDDALKIVQESMDTARARTAGREPQQSEDELLEKMLDDPKQIATLWDAFDRVTVYAVVEPMVLYHLNDDGSVIPFADRLQNALYTDTIDPEDKIHIFNFVCGGTSDVNRFREEQLALMADLSDGSDVQATAESGTENTE